jgi:dTDP-4-amino-4,6-dideoxygalactose transaminase
VSCSVHYKPLHRMSYWKDRLKLDPASFPGAEAIWQGCLSLPLFPDLQAEERTHVVESIRSLI